MTDTEKADKKFSRWIRNRDKKCLKCLSRPSTDCSHFFGRSNSATRYDPKNCIGLCRQCHMDWEGPKYEYKKWMFEWLGEEEYKLLEKRGNSTMKREKAIAEFFSWRNPPHHYHNKIKKRI